MFATPPGTMETTLHGNFTVLSTNTSIDPLFSGVVCVSRKGCVWWSCDPVWHLYSRLLLAGVWLSCDHHVTQCRTPIHCRSFLLLYDCHVIIMWPSLAPPPFHCHYLHWLFLFFPGSLPKRLVTWSSVTSPSIRTPTMRTLWATTTRNAGPGMPECASWNTTSTCESWSYSSTMLTGGAWFVWYRECLAFLLSYSCLLLGRGLYCCCSWGVVKLPFLVLFFQCSAA